MNKFRPIRISSKGPEFWPSLKEVFNYAGLLRAFTSRDLKVRYAQTYLGYIWSVVQPLLGLAAVFVLFKKVAAIPTGGIPYLAFALSGLVFWNYFNFVVTQSASSLIAMQAMIKKIYFPRLSIPLSKSVVGVVDWLVALALLGVLLAYYHLFSWKWLLAPLVLFLTAFAAIGIGLIVSALSIRFRDLQQVLPFVIQLLFFLTPVAYPSSLLQDFLTQKWAWIAYLNPMTGILDLWRSLLFETPLSPYSFLSFSIAVLICFLGTFIFIRTEKKMADLL